jgi:hypothetical protein
VIVRDHVVTTDLDGNRMIVTLTPIDDASVGDPIEVDIALEPFDSPCDSRQTETDWIPGADHMPVFMAQVFCDSDGEWTRRRSMTMLLVVPPDPSDTHVRFTGNGDSARSEGCFHYDVLAFRAAYGGARAHSTVEVRRETEAGPGDDDTCAPRPFKSVPLDDVFVPSLPTDDPNDDD